MLKYFYKEGPYSAKDGSIAGSDWPGSFHNRFFRYQSGYGSTDLWLYTSTRLKIVHCCLCSTMHKRQKLYLINIYKLNLTKIYF
jgi:hypothetical protein